MTEQVIDNKQDYLYVRHIIAVVEADEENTPPELVTLLEDLKGNGGDVQWRGDWYPIGLIRDSYWREYAQDFADEIGAIRNDVNWPHNCIDWERAAEELQMDYSTVDFDGVDYHYR